MDLELRDHVYLVTGGSRGLGLATAEVLVDEQARVVLSGRDEAAVERAARELGTSRAIGVAADNADPRAAERLVAAAVGKFGRIDGAVVSVGGPPVSAALDVSDETWRASFESVFLGAARTARAVVTGGSGSTSVVFVLSTSVRTPLEGLAISNALRPALAGLAKSLADELGPRGVRVNGVLPGRISTSRTEEIDGAADDPAAARAAQEARIPLRRYGTPRELGRVAAFLLSPAASYVTGALWSVDGGATRAL